MKASKFSQNYFYSEEILLLLIPPAASDWIMSPPRHNGTKTITLDKKMVYAISHRRNGDSSISGVYFNFLPQVRPFPQIRPGFNFVFLRVSKCDISLSASHMPKGIQS